jgi:hypothetical protein
MTHYVSQPRKTLTGDNIKPAQYSLAHVVFTDGTETQFMVRASPSVVPHLTKDMKETGFLTLWNDTDTLCIRADQVKHFSMREITKE